MTELDTFLADFVRGITASAPHVEDAGFIECQEVQSHDPLGFFEPVEPAREGAYRLQAVHG